MKRFLLVGAVTLVALGQALSQALAADLPEPNAPRAPARYIPPPPPPLYSWGGIYIGINGGYGFGNSEWSNASNDTGNFNLNGGVVGGTIGANYQMGQFVMGVEADGDWSDISGSTTTDCGGPCQTSNDWLGTVRGRLGVAWDRVLFYGTAGGAGGNVKASVTGTGSTEKTEFGWTAGGGLEVGITDNLTAKVEYLFVDLSNGSCDFCGPPAGNVKFDTSLIRAGLNFKFNPF
jgi:outer membrane immunogenic protein